jgi:hypothetical protein
MEEGEMALTHAHGDFGELIEADGILTKLISHKNPQPVHDNAVSSNPLLVRWYAHSCRIIYTPKKGLGVPWLRVCAA